MRSSMNELSSLLKRVFESLFAHSIDFEACAADILWLETRQLGGVALLCDALPELAVYRSLNTEDLASDHVNCGGSSLIPVACLIGDTLTARTLTSGSGSMQLESAQHGMAVVPAIARAANRGMSIRARWVDAQKDLYHDFCFAAGEEHPRHIQCSHPQHQADATALLIDSRTSPTTRAESSCVGQHGDHGVSMNTEVFRQRVALSVENGLVIDDEHYAMLCSVADRLLVEASEESRRGAGA